MLSMGGGAVGERGAMGVVRDSEVATEGAGS